MLQNLSFSQLTPDVISSYVLLVQALESRFAERRTTGSFLAQLESRRLQANEKLAEYVADLKKLVIKGYPTADLQTRETIGLRYFLKGLQDPAMAVAVGMKDPQTMEEARSALDTYNSLREDSSKPPRVRAIQLPAVDTKGAAEANHYVTKGRLQEFGNEIKSAMANQFSELKEILGSKDNNQKRSYVNGQRSRSPSPANRGGKVECYACHEKGHFPRNCPSKSDPEDSDTEGASRQVGKLLRTRPSGQVPVQECSHFRVLPVASKTKKLGNSIVLPLELHNVKCNFVVDTGSVVTIVSRTLFHRIPPNRRPTLKEPSEPVKLEVATRS